MSTPGPRTQEPLRGELGSGDALRVVEVASAAGGCLFVDFHDEPLPPTGTVFDRCRVECRGRWVDLGRVRYEPHPSHPLRRLGDPAERPGVGRLIPLDGVFDFAQLFKAGRVVELHQKVGQLPMVWRRRTEVRPAFREFTADLLYDLQVYRSLFDQVDRDIEGETRTAQATIRAVAAETEYPEFRSFFDRRLRELEDLVSGFSRQEHEHHGFYFRKQVWDMIVSSEFLARTNLKPRGYAGDSLMMRMVYEDDFRGPGIFAQFMHRHPIQTEAAQAVRNRRQLLGPLVEELRERRGEPVGGHPFRVMSVACGPAWELRDLLTRPEDAATYEFSLLDQDPHALSEAQAEISRIEESLGTPIRAHPIRDSVRTMLRTRSMNEVWGSFDFLYSMGLFDYLTKPVATAVLSKLYELLRPGGELVIGNFHVGNPTRIYMEYWMDWVLFYRTEDDFLELADELPGAEAALTFEETRSQMFLRIRKPD